MPATRIWYQGWPAEPLCETHYLESAAHADMGCACLARLDDAGVWQPTDELGGFRGTPFPFDW